MAVKKKKNDGKNGLSEFLIVIIWTFYFENVACTCKKIVFHLVFLENMWGAILMILLAQL